MARLARLVIPGLPHHITQRGNRRQQTFFGDEDYSAYLELMSDWCRDEGVEIWGYCLMPNHVHLIAVPKTENGLGMEKLTPKSGQFRRSVRHRLS
jgi:putative transposase